MAQRFERKHLIRLSRLLDMMYKPSEIADEIEVTTETIYRSYLPGGCPFERDKNEDIWINGVSFRDWVEKVHAQRKLGSLAEGEAWCLVCKKAVQLVKPKERFRGRYVVIFQGKCPACGRKVNRAYAASSSPTGAPGAAVTA